MARTKPLKPSPAQNVNEIEAENERLTAAIKAKRKLQRELAELEQEPEGLLEPEEAKLPGAERIETIIAELGGEGSFHVYRIENGSNVKMGSFDLAAWPLSMESLVKRHGGGEFLINFLDGNGKKVNGITRTWDPSVYKPAETAARSGSSEFSMVNFLEIMDRKEARMQAQLDATRAEAAKEKAEANKLMIAAITANNKPMLNGIQDVVALLGVLNPKRGSAFEELLDAKELLEELKGDGDGVQLPKDAGMVERLGAMLLPVLTKALGAMPIAAAAPAAPLPAPTGPLPTAAQVAAQPKPELVEPLIVRPSIVPYLEPFKVAISSGQEPAEAAQLVFDSVSIKPEELAAVIALLEKGDWSPVEQDEFLKGHALWISAFKDKLLSLVKELAKP